VSGLRVDPALLQVDPSAFVARGAVVAGDVSLGAHASVWFGCVLRGDTDAIVVGARSNLQDGTIVHCDEGDPTLIGEGVTVGHRVVLHGCTIGDGALIGMGAIVLNRAQIGAQCLVGAGALVTQGKVFPPRMLILGSPARPVRALTGEEIDGLARSAQHYVDAGRVWREAGWHADPSRGSAG
jgi:carbonic anhydrase/acetyltransferase-like protein (isoleucine patch superfamily)